MCSLDHCLVFLPFSVPVPQGQGPYSPVPHWILSFLKGAWHITGPVWLASLLPCGGRRRKEGEEKGWRMSEVLF